VIPKFHDSSAYWGINSNKAALNARKRSDWLGLTRSQKNPPGWPRARAPAELDAKGCVTRWFRAAVD